MNKMEDNTPFKKHFMIDLETLGFTSNSVIAQIAAVEFFPLSGKIYRKFEVNVDIEDCQKHGLQIDASTVKFWLNQSNEAKKRVFYAFARPLSRALNHLYEFVHEDDTFAVSAENIIMWANSPSFDLEILKNAYKKTGSDFFWQFRNERDFRTISQLFPDIAKNHERIGEAHTALSDCINQAAILAKCLENIPILLI